MNYPQLLKVGIAASMSLAQIETVTQAVTSV